ncbi:DDE-type integrase/transposase/recombinase [Streptomyces lincolnensis]|nr:DDE-type integrase/transposase/recombinase [Streptomyces lincolnensis]
MCDPLRLRPTAAPSSITRSDLSNAVRLLEAAARTQGGSLDGAIFHSDNGAQYASKEFAKVCSRLGVIRSRGAVGTSADNAAAESFNATLKRDPPREDTLVRGA